MMKLAAIAPYTVTGFSLELMSLFLRPSYRGVGTTAVRERPAVTLVLPICNTS
jgi:hypothetical protein